MRETRKIKKKGLADLEVVENGPFRELKEFSA